MHGSCNWSYVSGPYEQYEHDDVSRAGGIEKFLIKNPDRVFGFGKDSPKKI